MWLSERAASSSFARRESAELGRSTGSGERVNVFSELEYRDVPVAAPGGYLWRPGSGDQLLVVKCGEGEGPCVAGRVGGEGENSVEPGELLLYSQGASLRLTNEEGVAVTGDLAVGGGLAVGGNLETLGNLAVAGGLNVAGDVHISGRLYVNGALCALCAELPEGDAT